MKNQDQILLEECYKKVVLKEGLSEATLKPMFVKIMRAIKEKAPEAFNKLSQCRTAEEIQHVIFPKGVEVQEEGVSDFYRAVQDLFKFLTNPGGSVALVGGVLYLLGKIVMVIAPGIAGGFAFVCGLILIAISVVATDSAEKK